MRGLRAVQKTIDLGIKGNVLDLGCGDGNLYYYLKGIGPVTGVDIKTPSTSVYNAFIQQDIETFLGDTAYEHQFKKSEYYNIINLSHVLEHLFNPIDTLLTIRETFKFNYLLVSVPVYKPQIVGGHINLYNLGMLMYHLVLAGYDCNGIVACTTNKEVSVVLPVKDIDKLPDLNYDNGDIELLAPYFPEEYREHGFNGNIDRINWD